MGGRKRMDDVGWSGKQEPLTEKDVGRKSLWVIFFIVTQISLNGGEAHSQILET